VAGSSCRAWLCGLLYVANEASGTGTNDSIFIVNPATGARTLFASDLIAVEGLRFAPTGTLTAMPTPSRTPTLPPTPTGTLTATPSPTATATPVASEPWRHRLFLPITYMGTNR
jgi:hypothetical protein